MIKTRQAGLSIHRLLTEHSDEEIFKAEFKASTGYDLPPLPIGVWFEICLSARVNGKMVVVNR